MKKKSSSSPRLVYSQLKEPARGFPLEIYTCGGHYQATPTCMPGEVKVYGQVYKVYYHTRIYNERKKNTRLRGAVVYAHRVIYIDPCQSIPMMRETFYHEVGHIYLKHWQEKAPSLRSLSYQQSEDICDMLGEVIPDLASNNQIST